MLLDDKDFEHSFKSVVATESGRKFVAHLIDICDVGHSTISDNQRIDDYRAGKRYIGEMLLRNFKELALSDYIKVLKEEQNEQLKFKKERNDENE